MTTKVKTRTPAWLVGSGVIAVAIGVMNVSTYGFTIVSARLLGPRGYGELAALMGLLLVLSVVALGLQATGARRVAADPQARHRIEHEILTTSYRAALVLAGLCLLATPLVTVLLRLDSCVTAVLLAVTVLPLTVMGGQSGVLQGERRWLALATVYLAVGLGRFVAGVLALLWRADAATAMLGVAIGAMLPALVGWWALRRPSHAADRDPGAAEVETRPRSLLREVAHNSHALLAFFALSNTDVLIARGVLDDQQSGLYAGGLILTKAVLFLPQFVVVVAFPSMASTRAGRSTHLKGLALVLAIGVATTVGALLLSTLAVTFIGGTEYAEIEPVLWGFAAVGTLLAMIQLMVYNVLARQQRRSVLVVWAGMLALVLVAPLVTSVEFLLAAVAVTLAVVLVVLVVSSLRKPVGV
jgi:O-antigen/teichoic acid export membrane protein